MTEEHCFFVMQHKWSRYNGTFWTLKAGDITWRMRPSSPLNKIDDNDDVYLEFQVLYDHHLSNLWKLETEIELVLFRSFSSTFPSPLIEINKICYFDSCQLQMRPSIRFDFGKFGSVKASIVPKDGSPNRLTFDIYIRVVKKSTIGMQLPSTDYFHISKNIESEVVLGFKAAEPVGGYPKGYPQIRKYYVDKLGLISVSSVFREMFSNKPNNNNEHMVNDIYCSTNFCEYKIGIGEWTDFLRLLYARKQEFSKDTIEGILYLAVRYDVIFLIADCEEFLISTEEISTTKKLRLAEKCDLAKLQLVALERMKIGILEKYKLDIVYKVFDRMGPKTLKAVLVKFCEEDLDDEDYRPK